MSTRRGTQHHRNNRRAGMHRLKVEFMPNDEAETMTPRTDRWTVGVSAFATDLDEWGPDHADGLVIMALDLLTVEGPQSVMRFVSGSYPTPDDNFPGAFADIVFSSMAHLLGDGPTASQPQGWRQVLRGAYAAMICPRGADRALLTTSLRDHVQSLHLGAPDALRAAVDTMRAASPPAIALGVIRTPLERHMPNTGENSDG